MREREGGGETESLSGGYKCGTLGDFDFDSHLQSPLLSPRHSGVFSFYRQFNNPPPTISHHSLSFDFFIPHDLISNKRIRSMYKYNNTNKRDWMINRQT